MRRREDHPLHKTVINLFKGDFQRLQELYPTIGASKVIRELVRNQIRKVEEEANQRAPQAPKVENLNV